MQNNQEICSVCGCVFTYPPVPREYAMRLSGTKQEGYVPACGACAAVEYDAIFRLFFGFPVGTEVRTLALALFPHEHRFMTAAECGCDKPHCPICVGGLAYCTVCKGAEGSLPTNCPGVPLTEDQEAGIYERGDLDFKDGRWFNPLATVGRPA